MDYGRLEVKSEAEESDTGDHLPTIKSEIDPVPVAGFPREEPQMLQIKEEVVDSEYYLNVVENSVTHTDGGLSDSKTEFKSGCVEQPRNSEASGIICAESEKSFSTNRQLLTHNFSCTDRGLPEAEPEISQLKTEKEEPGYEENLNPVEYEAVTLANEGLPEVEPRRLVVKMEVEELETGDHLPTIKSEMDPVPVAGLPEMEPEILQIKIKEEELDSADSLNPMESAAVTLDEGSSLKDAPMKPDDISRARLSSQTKKSFGTLDPVKRSLKNTGYSGKANSKAARNSQCESATSCEDPSANRQAKGFLCSDCGKRFSSNRQLLTHLFFCPDGDSSVKRGLKLDIFKADYSNAETNSEWESSTSFKDNSINTRELSLDWRNRGQICPVTSNSVSNLAPEHQKESAAATCPTSSEYEDSVSSKHNTEAQQEALIGEKTLVNTESEGKKPAKGKNRNRKKGQNGGQCFICSECGKVFTYMSNLLAHQKLHTGDKPFTCLECGKSFCFKKNLFYHQKLHAGEKPFTCKECGKGFSYRSSLHNHQRNHTEGKHFTCTECGKTFSRKENLLNHFKSHTGEKPFMCLECGKLFSHKASLQSHHKMHTGENLFICTECGKCFAYRSSLRIHLTKHKEAKRFECTECEKSFTTRGQLRDHLNTHTGVKPFLCVECGTSFSRASYLKRHIRVHTGEKPFVCAECGKRYSTSGELHHHKNTHTMRKLFTCTECGKIFLRHSSLRIHLKIHTGEKPFSCAECGRSFSRSSHLLRHKRNVHTVEVLN